MTSLTTVVADKIWALQRPVWFAGVRLQSRTTVVRLEDGGVLLHSAAPPTDALIAELHAIGPVRWLVVPNCFHHLGAPAAAARFTEAQVIGPASARDHNASLRIDVDIRDRGLGERLPEVELLALDGVPFLDETVLYHRPTATLLGADLVLRSSPADHWTWRLAARVTGCARQLRVPPDVRKKIVDRAAAARSLTAILARPARRLIVGHAPIVGEDWREQLAQAWRQEGVEV